MKLIYQAWHANDFSDWAIATAIMLGAVLALILFKYGVARAVTALARRTATPFDDFIAEAIRSTRIWLLFPLAVYAGASAVTLPPKLEHLIDIVVVVSLMLQAALWINRFVVCWLDRKIEYQRGVDGEAVTALTLIGYAARVVVWTFTLLLVLDHLHFDITALITGLGIGGVAVALALQNILGDLFASLSIVLDKPFVVGDFMVVGELRGTVEYIGLKTTRVRSLDGELIVFSNTDLLKSRIRNFKRMQERRIAFKIGVTYQTSADQLARIPRLVREAVESQAKTRFDRAHFQTYGDSSLIFEVVYYVLSPDYNIYMDIQQAINLALFRCFEREHIDFAYPTRTLYLRGGAVPGEAAEIQPC